jgi:hypothetical protein
MKYILAAILAICASTGYSYETLVPVNYGHVFVQQPVIVQTYVYNTPYFVVTVPVPVQAPVYITQPVQQTMYWGYPYQTVASPQYLYQHRCRLFNFNY